MKEELTKELNLLQEKFNKDIEDVKKKYEKKEKTLDDLASEFREFGYDNMSKDIDDDFKQFLTENKQEVIETLNNL